MNFCNLLTSSEFEKLCTRLLLELAEKEKLPEFQIIHNEKVMAYDGKYQIDIRATFRAFNLCVLVFCECKCYTRKIERKVVTDLKQKLDSCGAHKGIIMAINGYQSGAIEFAKQHGIALLNIVPTFEPDPLHVAELTRMRLSEFGEEAALKYLASHVTVHTYTDFLTEAERSALKLDQLCGEVETDLQGSIGISTS